MITPIVDWALLPQFIIKTSFTDKPSSQSDLNNSSMEVFLSVNQAGWDSCFPFTVTMYHDKSNVRETVFILPHSWRWRFIMVESFDEICSQEAERDESLVTALLMFLFSCSSGIVSYTAGKSSHPN